MPPRKKTLEEHRLSGAVDKNPGRFKDRVDPPAPKAPIGKAPRHLDAEQQKIWRELTSNAPDGFLGSCDAVSVEIAVRLTQKMRKGGMDKTSEFTALFNVLSKLGLNPSDRTRVSVPQKPVSDTDDPLSELD